MSFKSFFSFACGVISYIIGLRLYNSWGNVSYLVICLIAGFIMAQVICYAVHKACQERYQIESRLKQRETGFFDW